MIPAGHFPVATDVSALFTANELAQPAILNGTIEFLGILEEFFTELPGQEMALADTEPALYAEHSLIPDVAEGDTLAIAEQDFIIREVQPENHGIVRCRLERIE